MAEQSRSSNPVADGAGWEKNPHGFKLGDTFATFKEAVEYAAEPDLTLADNKTQSPSAPGIAAFLKDTLPKHFEKPNYSDTSIGGNDAINALWQFNIDDDIIHPMLAADGKSYKPQRGLGRVYNEVYQNNMHLLWLRFGVPKFSKLSQFWLQGSNPGVARLMNQGPGFGLSAANIGRLLGKGLALAIKLPILPIVGAVNLINAIEDMPITKYYALRPTMTLYYRMVNVILAQLAVNMGIYGNDGGAAVDAMGVKIDNPVANDGGRGEGDTIPEIMKAGPDIFAMLDKRSRRVNGTGNLEAIKTDDLTDEMNKKSSPSGLLSVLGSIKKLGDYAFGMVDYVGFRIEKGTDASETVNNTTGESEIAGKINAAASAGREKNFSSAGGALGIPGIDQVIAGVKGAIEGLGSSIGAGAVTTVVTGNGFYDIPEVWKSSSFSKSYSFSIQLRAKYGDPVSIYQSIYVPLAMLLAAALPRGIGKNQYTSPFILEAYSRGMFAIPLGIIESMTIKRGLAEHGWTHAHLPTAVDVTLNIKDLSPAFFMSLASPELMDIFKANTTMEEYMATLSGLNIRERTFLSQRIDRRLSSLLLIHKNSTFNPLYWANAAGENSLVRLVSNVTPSWITPWKTPNN